MAKANQKSRDIKSIDTKFELILKTLDDMAEEARPIMPLLSESLQLSKSIVKMYRRAFKEGIKYAKK